MATYPNPLSDQAIADQLTRSGNHWAKTTITYSFDDLSTAGNDLNSTYESWIKKAIGQIGEILNLNFVETGSGGDITFNGSSGNGTYASTSYYTLSREIVSSNIFFDRTWSSNQPSALDYGSGRLRRRIGQSELLPRCGIPAGYASLFGDVVFRGRFGRQRHVALFLQRLLVRISVSPNADGLRHTRPDAGRV